MFITFLMAFLTFFLFAGSFMHYQNKIERNNIPNSIIKGIKMGIVNNTYKIPNIKNIKNVQFLQQSLNRNNTKSKNEYQFLIRSNKKVYIVKIEGYEKNNRYTTKYKSYSILEKEIRLHFFYSRYIVNTFLGIPSLSIKTIKFITIIFGIATFLINLVLIIWIPDGSQLLP